jgi:hypothetical protein
MMPALAIGLLILVGVMLVTRWFANTPPSQVLKTGRWAGIVLLLLAVIGLAVTGRLGWALAAFAGLVPRLVRLLQLAPLLRFLKGRLGSSSPPSGGGGGDSHVETPFLRMVLDHDSGSLSGEVLSGPLAGRALSSLSFDEAMAFRRSCAAHSQTLQLLDAWLDRVWPDWRSAPQGDGNGGAAVGPRPAMTRQEALDILGLPPDADAEAIKAAYHRLMVRLHPDLGGSNYLAAKINQAKDLLLRD